VCLRVQFVHGTATSNHQNPMRTRKEVSSITGEYGDTRKMARRFGAPLGPSYEPVLLLVILLCIIYFGK